MASSRAGSVRKVTATRSAFMVPVSSGSQMPPSGRWRGPGPGQRQPAAIAEVEVERDTRDAVASCLAHWPCRGSCAIGTSCPVGSQAAARRSTRVPAGRKAAAPRLSSRRLRSASSRRQPARDRDAGQVDAPDAGQRDRPQPALRPRGGGGGAGQRAFGRSIGRGVPPERGRFRFGPLRRMHGGVDPLGRRGYSGQPRFAPLVCTARLRPQFMPFRACPSRIPE